MKNKNCIENIKEIFSFQTKTKPYHTQALFFLVLTTKLCIFWRKRRQRRFSKNAYQVTTITPGWKYYYPTYRKNLFCLFEFSHTNHTVLPTSIRSTKTVPLYFRTATLYPLLHKVSFKKLNYIANFITYCENDCKHPFFTQSLYRIFSYKQVKRLSQVCSRLTCYLCI